MKRACVESAEYRLDIRLLLKSAGNTLKKRMSLDDKAETRFVFVEKVVKRPTKLEGADMKSPYYEVL